MTRSSASRVRELEQLVLAARGRQIERAAQADAGGDGLFDQLVERGDADDLQHLGDVASSGPMCRCWKRSGWARETGIRVTSDLVRERRAG